MKRSSRAKPPSPRKKSPVPAAAATDAAAAAEAGLLSIGDLAEAAGIAPDTLRAWERRYGRPQAVRLPSGHRRYTPEDVRWLRRVAEALALGHRPSRVVRLDEEALDRLLGEASDGEPLSPPVQRLLESVAAADGPRLRKALLLDAKKLTPRPFLRERLAPLLAAIGRSWVDGAVSIRHEHVASEVIEDVLRTLRAQIAMPRKGALVVLTTLPEERHGLGLQMVALECALAGLATHVLGVETPPDEIVRAVEETGAVAVAVSVSLATGGVKTDRTLAELRRAIPTKVRVLVGGAGARGVRRGPQGIEYAVSWDELERWLRDLAAAHA